MNLHPAQVQHLYDTLRVLPPFSKWKLPLSQGIIIKVIRSKEVMGDYEPDPHTLRVSSVMCQDMLQVLETVAHEMVHLSLDREGLDHSNHDDHFKARASEVCKAWGWKPETF